MTSRTLKTLRRIQTQVALGRYVIGSHAERHMIEEGFDKEHCIGAILDGRVIEDDPARGKCLISGRFHVTARTLCRLHVVCDYSGERSVKIITAFIPYPVHNPGKRRRD